jgi:hypothetical protein
VLHQFEQKFGFQISFNEQQLRARFPNGSQIAIMGADDKRDMERLRGSRYRIAVIDEAGSFPRDLLKYLVDDVISPAVADSHGDIWCVGSPNAAAQGYFYDATFGATPTEFDESKGQWPTWHWTALENTHFPNAKQEIELIIKRNGWNWDSPVVKREWLGQWNRDASSLMYRFDKRRNVEVAPDDLTRFVLGVDLGTSEKTATTAFVLLGYRDTGKRVWIVSATKEASMSPDSIADRIKSFIEHRKLDSIVCDAGGLGAGYIKHFVESKKLPVVAAEKRDKAGTAELCSGDFDAQRLMIDPGCGALISELEILPWNDKRTDSAPGCADHMADAMLYSWRAATAYANNEPPEASPKPGSAQAGELEMQRWRARWAKKGEKREWWEQTTTDRLADSRGRR